jgi:hypothetical protein
MIAKTRSFGTMLIMRPQELKCGGIDPLRVLENDAALT